jgi:chemotaxis protein methyltransferase CheR
VAIKVRTKSYKELIEDGPGYEKLRSLLKTHTGISLSEHEKNRALMATRVYKFLQSEGLEGYDELFQYLHLKGQGAIQLFSEMMTTNLTNFLREPVHFDFIKKNLGDYLNQKITRGDPDLRVWSSASSTGEEPYSILMTIREIIGNIDRIPLKFLASDIDTNVLKKALLGYYDQKSVMRLPAHYVASYFEPVQSQGMRRFRVRESYRNQITFAPFNLIDKAYNFEHQFDLIFCRNVLIYFDAATVDQVLHNLARSLIAGGYLFLGLSESSGDHPDTLQHLGNGVFMKKGS